MAFLAYTNNQTAPTEFEFQYYRSVSSHSASQQGDQVYVYKLNKNNGWSVIVREAYTKIAVGSTMTSSYSGGTLTLNANSYTLPTMATNTKGGAKLGNGLSITDDVLSVDASDVANGQLPIAHGGTGATTAAGARTNLGVLEYSNGVLDVDGTSAYLLFKTSSIANFAAPTGVGECAVMDTSDDSIYWHDGSTYTRLNPKDNLTDSGWVVLRASNNATTGRYRKLGSVVYLDISLGAPEQITVDSSGVYIGTLPEGYRPSDTIVTAATIMTSGSGQLTIETGGGVRAYNFATASKYLAAFIAFPVG